MRILRDIVDWLKRDPSVWQVEYITNIYRSSDGKCVGQNIVKRDQYGNVKTDKVRT